LVSDNDREEIKVIIPILEGFIKDRKRWQTKNPTLLEWGFFILNF
jgi:hypothetical protein